MPILSGLNQICKHIKRSEDKVLQWIRTKNFPARKIDGRYETTTDLIEEWVEDMVRAEQKKPRVKSY